MADNTLTGLIPTIYKARDKISRELTGMIQAVMRDTDSASAALDQTITIPIVPTATAYDVTPGQLPADNGEITVGTTDMSITKSRYSPIKWNGEEQKALKSGGTFSGIHIDRILQSYRVLTNEIEADLTALYSQTSNNFGTIATPFASNLTDSANTLKLMKDNGAPETDLQLVIDTTAGAALRTLTNLTHANENASDATLRRGTLLDLHGQAIRESAQIKTHTAGTGASATTDATGYAIGSTSIALASAGTGTLLTGDSITFAGDPNQYTLVTGDTNVADGGTIVLQEPGLKIAIPAGATAITLLATHTANMVFDRNAIALITRTPEMPEGGDQATDVLNVSDPITGLTFQIARYAQHRQVKWEIGIAWGVKVIAPRHFGRLLG